MRVIVVGAGFAGLAAADELRRAGAQVEVFEARDRVGGRVWSAPFAGAVAERGAEFILPGYDVLIATVERLGLKLVRKGTLYGDREPRGGTPVTRAEVAAAAARIASDPPAAELGTLADALDSYGLDPGVTEALRARIEVSCGYPADDLAASVLVEGAAAFGDFDSFTVEGGNDRIARELAGRAVRLSTPVRRISWAERKVRVWAGGDEALADAAVIAVPATVLDAIEFDPSLPAEKGAVCYSQVAKLFVALRTPAPPSQTLSVPERFWCYTQLGADGAPLPFVAAFAGTPGAVQSLTTVPDRWPQTVARLRPDLKLDLAAAVISTWHDDPWARGAYSAASATVPIDTEAWTRPAGALVFAGEHTAGAWHGLMEGALRSGIRAAQQLLHAAGR